MTAVDPIDPGATAQEVVALVDRLQRRCTAQILDVKDRIADPYLSEAESAQLRKAVFDAVGDFADTVRSVVPTITRDDIVLNGHAMDLLEAIHSHVSSSPAG